MASGMERIGTVLNGTYRLERLIGQGGMGKVYAAAHLRLPRGVAIKLLDAHALSNPQTFDRFKREAEIASSIGEEHIVEVSDFNQAEDGAPYMVMELLAGEDLAARLLRLGRLTLKQTARVVDHVAIALRAAHGRDIVHRDLKPENIFMCTRDGRDDFVKVLDFGISKIRTSGASNTQSGSLLGTPNFMAPEQAMAKRDLDHRVDIFALGAIAYECLTGKMAFDGRTLGAIVDQICHGAPVPMRSIDPEIPEAVEHVVERAMAKRREDRYPDVGAMRDEFVRACGLRTVADPLVTVARLVPEPVAALAAAQAAQAAPAAPPEAPRDTVADARYLPTKVEAGSSTSELASDLKRRPTRRGLVLGVLAVGILGGAAAGWMTRSPRTPAVPPRPAATAATAATVGPASLPSTPPPSPSPAPPLVTPPAGQAAAPAVAPTSAPAPAPPAVSPIAPAPTVAPAATAPPEAAPSAPPVAPVRMVRIRLRSRPKGAHVYRRDDNTLLGKTPFVLKLPAGKERVALVVKKKAYRDRVHWVIPNKNKVSRVNLGRVRK